MGGGADCWGGAGSIVDASDKLGITSTCNIFSTLTVVTVTHDAHTFLCFFFFLAMYGVI